MSPPLKAFVVAALVLLHAAGVDAADCACDKLSAEGCRDGALGGDEPTGPPQWCERLDDPRCMPASPSGASVETPIPVAMGWAQQTVWATRPRHGVLVDVQVDGGQRPEYSRRVERPPR